MGDDDYDTLLSAADSDREDDYCLGDDDYDTVLSATDWMIDSMTCLGDDDYDTVLSATDCDKYNDCCLGVPFHKCQCKHVWLSWALLHMVMKTSKSVTFWQCVHWLSDIYKLFEWLKVIYTFKENMLKYEIFVFD